jgi:hypothetical protein
VISLAVAAAGWVGVSSPGDYAAIEFPPTPRHDLLDRIIHNAHRIDIKGESMRRKNPAPGLTQPENPEIITEEE